MKRPMMVLLAVMAAVLLLPFSAMAAPKTSKFLKNLPVTGVLSDGGEFKGKVTITEVGYNGDVGFWVSGFLHGTATTADGTEYEDTEQVFEMVPATLNERTGSAAAFAVNAQQQCEILDLDIGAISLDLLGLQVDLAPIALDIVAESGAGNLLGNLLCAVAGLLDPNGFLDDLIGSLEDLLGLLNQINRLI